VKINKVSIWRGMKVSIHIHHANGMNETHEESFGGSLESWKDEGDTTEGIQNQLVGMMQIHLEAQAVGARAKLRELAGKHTMVEWSDKTMSSPPAGCVGGTATSSAPGTGTASTTPAAPAEKKEDEFPDIKVWYGQFTKGKMVSECKLSELEWLYSSDIYENGGKEKAAEEDEDAFMIFCAVNYWLPIKRDAKAGK